jgi:hypothetical protein
MSYPVQPYPVQFSVDYPGRPLGRLGTAFRIVTVIPIAIVLGAVSGGPGNGVTPTAPPRWPRAPGACCSSARC